MYLTKLKSETETDIIKQDYDAHLKSKKRYDLKATDTKMAQNSSTLKVLTGYLQKCLPTPLISNSLSFYKEN